MSRSSPTSGPTSDPISAAGKPLAQSTAAAPDAGPQLDLRGPLAAAAIVVALTMAGVATLASGTTIERGRSIEARTISELAPLEIVGERGGVLVQMHVKAGDEVARGDIIASFDTKPLEAKIATLRATAEATQRRLDPIRNRILELGQANARVDAAALVATLKEDLERQVAEIERERVGLDQHVAEVERQIADSVVRTPAAGRILAVIGVARGQSVMPFAALATIAPRLTGVAVTAPTHQVARLGVKSGATIHIWPVEAEAGDLVPVIAKVVRLASRFSPHEGGDLSQILLDMSAADRASRPKLAPGHSVRIMVPAASGQVLDALFAPFKRQPVPRTRGAKPEDAQ